MNLAELSVKRPVFITSIVFLMLAMGIYAIRRLGVDLFPDVTFPVITVATPYPGAGPSEIESIISKPLEDEVSSLAGLKRLWSYNQEGVSEVVVQFTLETDIKYAEQQVRDRVASVRRLWPDGVKDSIIRRIDPADQPIVTVALQGDLPPDKLFDLADKVLKPRFEQVAGVGQVQIAGGREREIHVLLDRHKLKAREISATQVAQRLSAAGEDIPLGKIDEKQSETVFRALGQFKSLESIRTTVVNFFGGESPTLIQDIAEVRDHLKDETSRAYINGIPALELKIFKQSGTNTIAVSKGTLALIQKLNEEMKARPGTPKLTLIRDASIFIRANVEDVRDSIFMGIILATLVVFLFLANGRSTIITSLALPNSILGAFVLMWVTGYTINIMTLLALSLAVGLLVDDAIVVRENIFRHLELGKPPLQAALEGTGEVRLAVIATTLTVISVFGPVGFLKGIVGQFFKQFGLTVCFAMLISLFDSLTIAPMLSAYFAGRSVQGEKKNAVLEAFERMHQLLESTYERILGFVVRRPIATLFLSFGVAVIAFSTVIGVPKTFLPPQDNGEFAISLDLPPGASLSAMDDIAKKVDEVVRSHKEVLVSSIVVGNQYGEANTAEGYVRLVPAKQRTMNTSVFKEMLRGELTRYVAANPKVKDFDAMGAGARPFNVIVMGNDEEKLESYGALLFDYLKKHKGLKDVDTSLRPGKPELQIKMEPRKAERLGVSNVAMGLELRALMEGVTPAKFRENGEEYDIRVRLKEDQRNLRNGFRETFVPNLNFNLIRLSDVSNAVDAIGPAKITHQDRSRIIQISSDIAPGAGMADIMNDIKKFVTVDHPMPEGISYNFVGQAEDFQELLENMVVAIGFAVLFIYFVLASLYESFITPFTIMLALPLAVCGAFLGLFVVQQSLNIFSMIGLILLLGVASKNSILLVDYTNQLMREGVSRSEAIIRAGKIRLRPILMTSMALIAGAIPIALGLNEASRQRKAMGAAIIGGLISSTLLTLVVVPAAFSFIDDFKKWVTRVMQKGCTHKGRQSA